MDKLWYGQGRQVRVLRASDGMLLHNLGFVVGFIGSVNGEQLLSFAEPVAGSPVKMTLGAARVVGGSLFGMLDGVEVRVDLEGDTSSVAGRSKVMMANCVNGQVGSFGVALRATVTQKDGFVAVVGEGGSFTVPDGVLEVGVGNAKGAGQPVVIRVGDDSFSLVRLLCATCVERCRRD